MSRVLVFVPNTATSDRRVIRQTNSLKEAGHEVEIVGVATTDKSATNAITDEQIAVTRVNWRAATYRKIFLAISARYALAAILGLAVLGVLAWIIIGAGFKWFESVFSPNVVLNGFHIPNGVLYGSLLIIIPVLAVIFLIALRIIRRRGPVANLMRAQQVATNYAQMEQTKDTFKEPLVFRALKWAANRSKRNKDLTFKATIEARINAMTEYGLEWKPDIAYCHEAATLPVGCALKAKLGCKLVYDAHEIYDDLANASPVQSATYQEIHRESFSQVDHFITVNPKILGFYLKTYPEIKNYTVMPNTVFPDDTAQYDGRLHEAAKLKSDAKILLYQGGFSPERGLDKLVQAASLLPEDWYLVMMGWGKLEKSLKVKAGAAKKATLRDVRQEYFQDYLTSDGFLARLSSLTDDEVRVEIDEALLKAESTYDPDLKHKSFDGHPPYEIEEPKPNKVVSEEFLEMLLKSPHDEIKVAGMDPIFISKTMAESLKQERSGIFDKVRFIPGAPHDELVSWSKGATIGVIPYENVGANHWNCSPNKIWEYANAGLPILASRLSFINEVIEEHGIGWTIATDFTAKDIATKINRITDADIKAKKKSCKAFIKIDSYHKYEPKLIDIFASLAS